METVANVEYTATYTSPLNMHKNSRINSYWEWVSARADPTKYRDADARYVREASRLTEEFGPVRGLVALLPDGCEWFAYTGSRDWMVDGEPVEAPSARLVANRGDVVVTVVCERPRNRWRNVQVQVADARFNDQRVANESAVEFSASSAKWVLTAPVAEVLAQTVKHTRPAIAARAQERLEMAEGEIARQTAEADYLRSLIAGYGA